MNTENIEAFEAEPNLDHQALEAHSVNPDQSTEVTEDALAVKLSSWKHYDAATLGADGKKRDADGNVVDYPHHLVTY